MRAIYPRTPEDVKAALALIQSPRVLFLSKFIPTETPQSRTMAGYAVCDAETLVVFQAPQLTHDFLAWAETKEVWVETMAVLSKLPFKFVPAGDLSLASRVFDGVQDPGAVDHYWPMDGILSYAERMWLYLAQVGDRRPPYWSVDLRAAYVLAEQSALGYLTPKGLVHPTWVTVQPNGSPVVSCQTPNLLTVKKTERHKWAAPDGSVWVQLRMPHGDWRMAAALSGDPWMASTEPMDIPGDISVFLRSPFSAEHMARKLGGTNWVSHYRDAAAICDELKAAAPKFFAWVEEIDAKSSVTSFMGRPVRETPDGTPEERRSRRFNALLQHSLATCTKSQLVQVAQGVTMGHPMYDRVENLMPFYDSVIYTISAAALDAGHLAHVGKWVTRTINGVVFPVEMSVGPTWGELTVVDPFAEHAETDRELASHFVPHTCPDCGAAFETQALLEAHQHGGLSDSAVGDGGTAGRPVADGG